ncbi:YeeE/YedE family protein [Achromobacter sp. F4_2707]|uniref:YeeE/YedE family protein n=1 Tax=Achromobacter sp. F4_2707 TaxID=3114286 RepID=UPI0039C6C748
MSRLPLTLTIALSVLALAWFVSLRQSALFLVGVGMGGILAGARFGFTTGWRRLIEQRDASGVVAQLGLLAVAAAISMPLLAYFPNDLMAALGPPSVSLLIGAFVFGAAMQIADGCGSGTLYKAGMGIPLNMAILPMFVIGSFLGSAHLDRWLSLGATPPVGLVNEVGPLGAFGLTLVGLVVIGGLALAWSRGGNQDTPRWLDRRLLIAGAGLALLAVLNLLLAGQPWGVVYGFGLWGAKIATTAGLFDPTANAFWSQPGNFNALGQTVFLDVTTITNLGILAGALWISARKTLSPAPLTGRQWVIGLLAGFLLGYSSRLAFGCNVGAMVSGISTGSLHGWIWVALAFCGSLIGVRMRRRFGF